MNNMTKMFEVIQERLNSVVIENLDFEKLIHDRDKKDTLFYCDPPYFNVESYYKNVDFTKNDHVRLYESLSKIQGKFILSYNDCEFIRELYKNYTITEIERFSNFTTTKEKTEKYKELIIKNF